MSKKVAKGQVSPGRIRYSEEDQRKAAEQVLLQNRPISHVAKEIGCSVISVGVWVEKFRSELSPGSKAKKSTKKKMRKSASAKKKSLVKKAVITETAAPVSQAPSRKGNAADSLKIEVVSKQGVTMKFPVETSPEMLYGVVKRLGEEK